MSEKPKRRWFRFHLMTAVMLMVILGGLGNAIWQSRAQCSPPGNIQCYERGWPLVMNQYKDSFQTIIEWQQRFYEWNGHVTYQGRGPSGLEGEWNLKGILVNAITAGAILALFTILCESLINRRKKRRQ